jgi:iron complex transport system substrate-binding protein
MKGAWRQQAILAYWLYIACSTVLGQPQSAPRIISLAPHITELLFAAGAGDRIVGALEFSNYPPAAKDIPRVGDGRALDLERIVALKPDVVIAWPYGYGTGQLDALRALGVRVEVSDPHSFEEIARDLERFGEIAGTSEPARTAAAALRARQDGLRRRYASRPVVSVFYQMDGEPIYTINGRHLISRAIELCGGRNVFADLAVLAPAVSMEAVVAVDPEAIVAEAAGGVPPAWLERWKRWPQLKAVRRNALIALDADQIARATPRIMDAVEVLCASLDRARSMRSGN